MSSFNNFSTNFNNSINSVMDPVSSNVYLFGFLKIFLLLYGTLAAPQIPASVAPIFSHTWFRIAVMAIIAWSYNSDPALSILIAVVYFLTMNYLTKNVLSQIQQTGVVSSDNAAFISGGNGTSIKSDDTKKTEAQLMQASVTASLVVPNIIPITPQPVVPLAPAGAVPQAFVPDSVHTLAQAP